MAALQTDWLNLVREGKTWSGRIVTAVEIHEMAASYNPDLHVAVINYRHHHGWINLGKVIELQVIEDDQKKVRLQGRLEPNQHLMDLNASGQDLHFSVEIAPESPETNQAYLYGVAMTDDPDSMGTSELKLFSSKNSESDTGLIKTNFEKIHLFDNPEASSPLKKKSFFDNLFNKKDDEESMDKKQFAEFMAEFKASMARGFENLAPKPTKDLTTPVDDKGGDGDGEKDAPWKKELSAVQDELKTLKTENEKLVKQFSTPAGDETDGGEDAGGDDSVEAVL